MTTLRALPCPSTRETHILDCLRRFRTILADRLADDMPPRNDEAEAAIAQMAGQQFDLTGAFDADDLPADVFQKRLLAVLCDGYAEVERCLGRERFIKAFDGPAEAVAGLFAHGAGQTQVGAGDSPP